MNKIMFCIAIFLVAIASQKTEASEGTYVSIMGGANAVDKILHNSASDIGFITTGAIGYTFSNAISLEGEVGYRSNDISKYADSRKSGYVHTLSFMAHVLYHFQTDYYFTPYLGAGFGSAFKHSKIKGFNYRIEEFFSYKNKDHRLAWDLIAGIAFPITENIDIDIQYRYFYAFHDNKSHNNSVGAGLKYSF